MKVVHLLTFLVLAPLSSCSTAEIPSSPEPTPLFVKPGAWQTSVYFPLLENKKFGLVCNHTSTIGTHHLVDTLIRADLRPVKLFAPEHGFRGELPDGQHIGKTTDKVTNLEIISLYGQQKKPLPEDMVGLDIMVFDIQDVGVRFYTYLSTLHYVMEACAEAGVPLLLLDRPNPNGHYIDGPVLNMQHASFVGLHPVPVVTGMTIGEYARMINGEQWLAGHVQCELQVIPIAHYDRNQPYELPVRPSPNLPNMRAIYLYPSLCFFEGTVISVGRGTEYPFQLIGHPLLQEGDTWFMPVSRPESIQPPQRNKDCRGWDLTELTPGKLFRQASIDLNYLLNAYRAFPHDQSFFLPSGFFEKLAGTDALRRQVIEGMSAEEIRNEWSTDLRTFKSIRAQYLLYPDHSE